MSINATLNKSSPSNFQLFFPKLPTEISLEATKELTLNIYSTIVPSLSLDVTSMPWMGAKIFQESGGITYDPWNTSFLVDSDFKNWKVLWYWLTYILNNKDIFGRNRDEFVVDATLHVTDNFDEAIFKLFFVNVWITSLGEITLSTREGENVLECQATFQYDRYEIRE